MPFSPMYEQHPELAQVALKYQSRTYQGPLDDTSVWNDMESASAYIRMRATYAYPGQIITVLNKTDDDTTKDPTFVIIKANGDYQILGQETTFDSMDAAKSWLVTNANYSAKPGTICTIKYGLNDGTQTYGLFAVNEEMTDFERVSFNQEDVPEVSWDSIINNPFEEDESGKLSYTDNSGSKHVIAYKSDLNKPLVLDTPPENAEAGLIFYQKI